MSVVVDLPIASILVSIIITEWLYVKDWNQLDTAYCNHGLRIIYLKDVDILMPFEQLVNELIMSLNEIF